MALLDIVQLAGLLRRNLPAVDHRDEVIEAIGDSTLRLRLPVRPGYLSRDLPPGSGQAVFSAPVMMGFADTALYACVHTFYGADVFAAIVSFNLSCFSVAGDADLVAQARLIRKGRRLAFVEAHLFSGAATTPCAQVTATYAIRDLAPQA